MRLWQGCGPLSGPHPCSLERWRFRDGNATDQFVMLELGADTDPESFSPCALGDTAFAAAIAVLASVRVKDELVEVAEVVEDETGDLAGVAVLWPRRRPRSVRFRESFTRR